MKKLITLLSLAVVGLSFGQEEEPKFNFSGSIDAYFRTNMNSGNDGQPDVYNEDGTFASPSLFGQAPPSAFANQPGFALGMANIVASYEGETVGFVADLMFGPRADAAILDDANPINQMYMYWNVNDMMTLTMGRFNTFYGYEVISTPGNFNYSTSHLFSFGPFSHNGLKADFKINDDFTAMVAFMNPTDVTTFNNADADYYIGSTTGDYALGFQLGYKGQYFNVLSSQGNLGIDFTGGFDLTDGIYLGINAAKMADEDGDGTGFYGAALYPQLTMSDTFSWGMRLEYFVVEEVFSGDDLKVFTPTITANYSIGDLTIKPELRLDSANEDIFIDSDSEFGTGANTAILSSFVLGAVYTF